jgi:Peptidyl-tRNA hydrolase PTH2
MSSTAAASPSDQGTVEEPATQSRSNDGSSDDVLVQYVVLRRDLIDTWPLGSVVTQGCHASAASVWTSRDHPDTLGYCSDSNLDYIRYVRRNA